MAESKNTPDWGAVFREQMNFWRVAMSMISSGHRSMRSWIAANMRHGDTRRVDLPWQGAPSPNVVMRGIRPTTAVTVWRPPVALRALSSEDAANAWHRAIGGGPRPPSGAGRRDDVSRLFTSNAFYRGVEPPSMFESSAFAVSTPEQAAAWRAEQKEAEERHERASSLWKAHRSQTRKRKIQQDRAWRLDTMDPYERDIEEKTERYGSRERAEQKAVEESIGWLPKWGQKMLKNSTLSTKNIVFLGKNLKDFPIVGKAIGMAMNRPVAAATAIPFAIAGVAASIFARGTRASKELSDWENIAYLTGPLPSEFENAAREAGLTNRSDIYRRYAKAMKKYGDASLMYKGVGEQAERMSPRERMYLAESLEMDEADMMIASRIVKKRPLSAAKQRIKATGLFEKSMIMAAAPDSPGIGSNIFSAIMSLPIMHQYGAWLTERRLKNKGLYSWPKFKAVEEAVDSAERAKSGAGRPSDSGSLDDKQSATRISINIGDIALPGVKDARGFMDEIASLSDDAAGRNMVLASFDRMVV